VGDAGGGGAAQMGQDSGRTGVDRAKGPFRWGDGGGGLLKRDRAHNKCAMYRMFSCSLLAVGCGVGCCSGDCLTAVSRTLAQHVSKSYQYSGI
jgi:hypothetical protein